MEKWISVKDELPCHSSEVLIVTKGGVIGIGYYDSNGIDTKWTNRSHTFYSKITHWMPLPDRPEAN